MEDNLPHTSTARDTWLRCINDIQDHTMQSLSDVFSGDEFHRLSTPPLLYINPAYHGNAGDNFITFGTLIFIEKMGSRNFTECDLGSSIGLIPHCGNFSHFEEGGLAIWHGGGNWGDVWGREEILLKRLDSIAYLAKKGKTVIGFPQSMHYNNKDLQTSDAKMFLEKFSDFHGDLKKNVILTWRQKDSFELAKELYPFADNR